MTKLSNINFDYKFILLIAGGIAAWYDLKTEFKVFKATTELRIESLEKKEPLKIAYIPKREAILPAEIRIEDEHQ